MVKSRYTFEKREREKAKQQKQREKLEQRRRAKKMKADSGLGIVAEEADSIGLSTVSPPLVEDVDDKDRQ